MRFTLTWRGQSWTDEDVLAMDLVTVQFILGGAWENFDPWTGPAQVVAFIAALVARSTGRDFNEILAEVRGAKADELLNAIEPREEEPTDGVH